MQRLRRVWHYAISDGVPRRAFLTAVIVGSVLNAINQGDKIVSGAAALGWTKLLLTYLVPYCTTTFGAVSFRLHTAKVLRGDPPPGAAGRADFEQEAR